MAAIWMTSFPFIITQTIFHLEQYRERQVQFQRAMFIAHTRDKPMLEIGKPYGKIPFLRNHPCGDTTVDIDPAVVTECPVGGLVADVRELPFHDKTFGSSFASHVLEHLPVDDIPVAWQELHRVSDVVFVAGPREFNILALLIPDHTCLCYQMKNGSIVIKPFSERQPFVLQPLSPEAFGLYLQATEFIGD